MIDVRRENRAPARDLVADKLRGNRLRKIRPPRIAGVSATQLFPVLLKTHVLADRHEFHLGSHDSAPRVVHLGDVGAFASTSWLA